MGRSPCRSSDATPARVVAQGCGDAPLRRNGVALTFSSAFDKNGVLYHIATDGGKKPYKNPHTAGLVVASMSSVGSSPPADPPPFPPPPATHRALWAFLGTKALKVRIMVMILSPNED